MTALVNAGSSERWRAALGLAGYAALRLGEVRALRWCDVDFDTDTISVSRSLLTDGTAKATKSEAGTRTVALFPELRRRVAQSASCEREHKFSEARLSRLYGDAFRPAESRGSRD
jgi:integrase